MANSETTGEGGKNKDVCFHCVYWLARFKAYGNLGLCFIYNSIVSLQCWASTSN